MGANPRTRKQVNLGERAKCVFAARSHLSSFLFKDDGEELGEAATDAMIESFILQGSALHLTETIVQVVVL
jgi:hypothetical protein